MEVKNTTKKVNNYQDIQMYVTDVLFLVDKQGWAEIN